VPATRGNHAGREELRELDGEDRLQCTVMVAELVAHASNSKTVVENGLPRDFHGTVAEDGNRKRLGGFEIDDESGGLGDPPVVSTTS
jgi:hypothetical protein